MLTSPPHTPPPPHDERPSNISLGELDLTGLDLINLDLDELTDMANSNSHHQSSPDDAFSQAKRAMASNARKGKHLYAASLTSEDGSSSQSRNSMSSAASNSSFSSNCSSNYSSGSTASRREGKRLVALGLAASEVVALSKNKKIAKKTKRKKEQQEQHKQDVQQQKMTDKEAASRIQKEFLLSFHPPQIAASYEPLTPEQISRMAANVPRISTLVVPHLATLFDRITNEQAHMMYKHSRRFEYEFRTRALGGKRRDKTTDERVPILLGEYMSKYVFMPKTQHLLKNGDLLFLQLFNMFMHKQWTSFKKLCKNKGSTAFRNKIVSLEQNKKEDELIQFYNRAINGTKGYWLKGIQIATTASPLYSSPSSSRRKSKKKSKRKKKMSSRSTSFNQEQEQEQEQWQSQPQSHPPQQKERRHSSNPTQFDEYVDENGEKIWTDRKSGRVIKSGDLRNPETSDPYDGWNKIIDGYGRVIYIHPESGESVVADHSAKVARKKESTDGTTGAAKKTRRSLVGRGIHKVGKWLSGGRNKSKNAANTESKKTPTAKLGMDNV
jgi:hypothetical protein